jgi:hypothetical protein
MTDLYGNEIPVPKGFVLDTTQKFDEARKLKIFIVLPITHFKKPPKYSVITTDFSVKMSIEKQKKQFIKELDELIEYDNDIINFTNSYFFAIPISIYKNEKIISYLFNISYYHAGAPHPMDMYHSLNFDAKNMQLIDFKDYFLVESKADTTFFTDIITRSISNEDVFLWELYDNLGFNIEKDTILFNFSCYEIASYTEGLIQAKIHKKELYDKINTKYR